MPPAQAGPVVVLLPAEIDVANADSVDDKLTAACGPGAVVVADMTATTFCDSTGMRALILAYKHAAARGADLRLLRPCPEVMRIIRVLGLDAVLPIYQTLETASAGGATRRTVLGLGPDAERGLTAREASGACAAFCSALPSASRAS